MMVEMLSVVGKNPNFSSLSGPPPLCTGLPSSECSQGKSSKGWQSANELEHEDAPRTLANSASAVRVHTSYSFRRSFCKRSLASTNYSIWIYDIAFSPIKANTTSWGWGAVGCVNFSTYSCQKSRTVCLLFSLRFHDNSVGPQELSACWDEV